MYRNNELWMKNFEMFKEYISNPKSKFFTSNTVYKGVKIGSWYMSQIVEYKNCSLPHDRAKILKKFYSKWYDFEDMRKFFKIEYEKNNKEFLWVYKTNVNFQKVFEFIISKNLNNSKELFNHLINYKGCYFTEGEKSELIKNSFKFITSYSFATYLMLSELYNFKDYKSCNNPIQTCNKNLKGFIKSEEELIDKAKLIFSYLLSEKNNQILFYHFDIKNDNINSFSKIAEEEGLTRERVRQIVNTAISKYEKIPSLKKLLLSPYENLNIDLPKNIFSNKTIEILFSYEIFTEKNLENITVDELKTISAISHTAFIQITRYTKKAENINPFNPVIFSNRTKNALLRNKITNFDDVVNSIDYIPTFRGIGPESIKEIYDSLNELGYNFQIPEKKVVYFYNPNNRKEVVKGN